MGSNIVAAAIVGALVAGTAAHATQDVIRGNKDIEMHAGDVDIDVGRPED